jgi:hypothetical protein
MQGTMAQGEKAGRRRFLRLAQALSLASQVVLFAPTLLAQAAAGPVRQSPEPTKPVSSVPIESMPRGKKLVLKDGNFQLVREYKIEGERIRYYSLERSQWEEIPMALVDWEATRKLEAEDAKRGAETVAKAHEEEQARRAEPLEIDASIEAAPGVFLPPGEGLFVFDGKGVFPLTQAETDIQLNKGHLLKQVLVPIPIIPTRHTVTLKGSHALFRIGAGQVEFYMRTADGREPEMELIRAKVRVNKRLVENLDMLFDRESAKREALPMERWQIAPGVYRFTMGRALEPGEYALTEILEAEGRSLYVWDFGVDAGAAQRAPKKE